MNTIRRILVPTDFSAHADEAFRVAHALARMMKAEVVLFHVAQPPAVVSECGRFLTHPGQDAVNLWERFHAIQAAEPDVKVEHQVIVSDRRGAKHILDILDHEGCDLIVMGTHGHSWVKHLLFGSVTEEVVHRARCPVMVVKAPPVATPVPSTAEPAEAVTA